MVVRPRVFQSSSSAAVNIYSKNHEKEAEEHDSKLNEERERNSGESLVTEEKPGWLYCRLVSNTIIIPENLPYITPSGHQIDERCFL